MKITFNPFYIEGPYHNYVKFDDIHGDFLLSANNINHSSILIYLDEVREIEKKDDWIIVKSMVGEQAHINKIKYSAFKHKFIINYDETEIRINMLEEKIDKLSAHVLNIMISLGYLSKDYGNEFP